jgi:hypothetical protein
MKQVIFYLVSFFIGIIIGVSVMSVKLNKVKKERKMYAELSASLLKQLEKASNDLRASYEDLKGFWEGLYTYLSSYRYKVLESYRNKALENINIFKDAKVYVLNDSIVYGRLREQLEEKGYRPNRSLLEKLGKEASGRNLQILGF